MKEKFLLILLLVACLISMPALAADGLSDERLVDMATGPEVVELVMNVQQPAPSAQDKRPLFSVAVKGALLHSKLPTPDYEAKLVPSKRGVIFTHKQAQSQIVLVRTRYTDEDHAGWTLMYFPKDTSGHMSVRTYRLKNHDYEQFGYFLASIVP